MTAIAPCDIELERAALGSAFYSAGAVRTLAAVPDELFFLEGHRELRRAFQSLAPELNGRPPDLLVVKGAVECAGRSIDGEQLAGIFEAGISVVDLSRYLQLLRDLAARREEHAAAEMVRAARAGDSQLWPAVRIRLARAEALRLAAGGPERPALLREGLDLALVWPNGIRFGLTAIRDGRDGVRGELTVTHGGRRLSWGAVALASTVARETLRKKLEAAAPGLPWVDYLEEAAGRLTEAARVGEPLVTLTGAASPAARELVPRLLFEGEPTLLYGDGDVGKSFTAAALGVAVQSGVGLPFGLKPARAVPVGYIDWETSAATLDERVGLLAAGLGVDPPPILYKRMTRPLVDEAALLAAEFARRRVGLVIVDSMMFAVAGGDGAAFHEPITTFYAALRLFAPAAVLVLSHVTGADARGSGPSRPYGGAFAFNGPRLVWEARRDRDVTDATAIAFTCTKANNLPRRPDPFGLRLQPGLGTITVYPFDLGEAAPETLVTAPLPFRIRAALGAGPMTLSEIAGALAAKPESVRKALQRLRDKGTVALDGDLYRSTT